MKNGILQVAHIGCGMIGHSHAEAIAQDGIDMAIVCSPSSSHAEATIAFANAGVHILCEKPLDAPLFAPARDVRQAIDLILTIYRSSSSGSWEDVPLFD